MRRAAYHTSIFILFLFLVACGQSVKKDTEIQNEERDGATLFAYYICNSCHSLDGREMYGPTLKEIYNKELEVTQQGQAKTIIADRKYLIRAITDPDYEKVKGFENMTMPVPDISKKDVDILVDYLIALDETNQAAKTLRN